MRFASCLIRFGIALTTLILGCYHRWGIRYLRIPPRRGSSGQDWLDGRGREVGRWRGARGHFSRDERPLLWVMRYPRAYIPEWMDIHDSSTLFSRDRVPRYLEIAPQRRGGGNEYYQCPRDLAHDNSR